VAGLWAAYQDYVYGHPARGGGGAGAASFAITPGNSVRAPRQFVPHSWRLAADAVNVSAGLRRFAARVCGTCGDQRQGRHELAAIPWVVMLCDQLSIRDRSVG
jgi:hypothetical protein